ncbi:MAG: hypothetical protein QOH90_2341, partial [Actinomycetota bacterium]|nr:hypothetical protein [Actinomycetota bacterium]
MDHLVRGALPDIDVEIFPKRDELSAGARVGN